VAEVRVRGVYGKPWSEMANIEVSNEVLGKLAECLIKTIAKEAKKDFAKRGWTGDAPHSKVSYPGGPPTKKGPKLWDSFSYNIRGKSTLEIESTFWGLKELMEGVPSRKMTWLTQEHKKRFDGNFHLTPAEKSLGMRRRKRSRGARAKGGSIELGRRLPLVVPLTTKAGTVILRMAPLKTQDAWVHPGIAKFTFMERAIRKGRVLCAKILVEEAVTQLSQGDPTK